MFDLLFASLSYTNIYNTPLIFLLFIFQNQGGDTPLHIAVTEQSLSSVSTLLRAGADMTAVNFKLCTPLHVAAELGLTV